MRKIIGSLAALAATSLFIVSFGDVAQAQLKKACPGQEASCGISEVPQAGVRIVRRALYTRRPAYYVSGDLYTTVASLQETARRFAVVDLFVPPGQGPAPHLHTHEFEVFFVLQGQLSFYVGVEPFPPFNIIEKTVGPGTAVYAPVCRVMGFKNRTNDFGHALTFALPGGIDNGFRLTGDEVLDFTKPPPATQAFIQEQINRLVFWGDHSGEVLPFFQGQPPPACPPGVPNPVISSITGEGRPMELGPFGEKRFVLVTPQEAGLTTGAVAFCGQTATARDGGTVKVTSFTMPNQSQVPPPYISPNYEAFYVFDGVMWLLLEDGKPILLEPFTYLEIQPGVPFTLIKIPGPAPTGQILAWTVIGACQH